VQEPTFRLENADPLLGGFAKGNALDSRNRQAADRRAFTRYGYRVWGTALTLMESRIEIASIRRRAYLSNPVIFRRVACR